ncbi:hypothetical protein [Trichothermofontia sp.]
MLEDNPVAPQLNDFPVETQHEPTTVASEVSLGPEVPVVPIALELPVPPTADDGAATANGEAAATILETIEPEAIEPEAIPHDRETEDAMLRGRAIETSTTETDGRDADGSASSQALIVLEPEVVQGLTDYAGDTKAELEADETPWPYAEELEPESRGWLGWPVLAAIGLVCVVSFGGSLFLFTRPCAISSCRPLELAESLQAQAIAQANADTYNLTTADLAQARQQLLRAIEYLGQVPRWSEAAKEANYRLPHYRTQLKTLELIIAAQDKATAAAQRSQNPPHPLAEWTAIRALWQAAIASLEKVPKTSDLAPLAERKLLEYRVNLNAIAQRIQREQESDRHLVAAQTAADTANSRQPHASTLADWQELVTLWESAVRPLQLIPSGTMAHVTATDLLPYYQGKLNTVRDRITQEEAAERTYRKALQWAEQAKASERQNQWSKALADWQQARSLLQSVPLDTIPADQAKALIPTYDEAIRLAQSNVVAFNNLQNIRSDLEQACGGQPRRCTHSVGAAVITVTLTPDYEATLNTAERLQSELVRAEITNQWQALEFALQSISRNAGIPVQVYDSTGSLLANYPPNG